MRFVTFAASVTLATASMVMYAHATPPAGNAAAAPVTNPPVAVSPPAATTYSTSTTLIGTLLQDPAARAVLAKHMPEMLNKPDFPRAAGLTLKQVQGYNPPALSDQTLAAIDADFAKLSPKN
jgi:hypothetical protein